MRIVYQPVEDGICQSGIGNAPVPLVNWNLGGNQGGSVAKAIIEDFQDVLRILNRNGIPHPIIKNKQTAFGQGTQCAREGTIGADLAKGME